MRFLYILLILLFFINTFFFGETKRGSVSFLYNANYNLVFEEDVKIFDYLKYKFKRDFFKIKNHEIPLINSVEKEVELIAKQEYETMFISPPIFSAVMLNKIDHFNRNKTKILSYNIYIEDSLNINVPVFNILLDPSIMVDKLLSLIKDNIKSRDFSKCGIIVDSDYNLAKSVLQNFEDRKINLTIFEGNVDNYTVIEWIKGNNLSLVICFGYSKNSFIKSISRKDVRDTKFIEVLTDYHLYNNGIVNYYVGINWKNNIEYALNSSAFRRFKKYKVSDYIFDRKVENFFSKNRNSVFIKRKFVNNSNVKD